MASWFMKDYYQNRSQVKDDTICLQTRLKYNDESVMKKILAKGEEQESFKEDFTSELQEMIGDLDIKIKILGIKEGSVVVEYTLIKDKKLDRFVDEDWFKNQITGLLSGKFPELPGSPNSETEHLPLTYQLSSSDFCSEFNVQFFGMKDKRGGHEYK